MEKQLFKKSSLSRPRKRLLELMQEINFGRITDFTFKEGEPVFTPSMRVSRDIKFGGENGPRQERNADDFYLKSKAAELFKEFQDLGAGQVEWLDVKHGLPFQMRVTAIIRN